MKDLIYHPLTQALGSTVLHSFWQAISLAIVLWICSRRKSLMPSTRYKLAYTAMFAQLVLSLATFWIVYEPINGQASALSWTSEATAAIVALYTNNTPAETTYNWIESLYFGLSLIWLIGIVFGSLRLLGGTLYLQIRFNRQLISIPEEWIPLVQRLGNKLDQRPSILGKVKLSKKIGSPAMIGLIKPLILFPVSIVNQLEIEEVEALLAHELAHYTAKDHWWNFLQTCIEILFYYNPAMHWISNRVREEREFRCDQKVADIGISPLVYATALYKIEEQRLSPQLNLAARQGSLLSRIERLLRNTPNYYHMKPGLLIFLLLIVGTLFSSKSEINQLLSKAEDNTILAAENTDYRSSNADVDNIDIATQIDTFPLTTFTEKSYSTSTQIMMTSRDGKDIELVKENGEVKSLIIDGRQIPSEEYDEYEDLVADISLMSPPAPPTPPSPPSLIAPPTPPSPPVPPSPPTQLKLHSSETNGNAFIMDLTDDGLVMKALNADSILELNFKEIGNLSWLQGLGDILSDALSGKDISEETETQFEKSVEDWAQSMFTIKFDSSSLNNHTNRFRMCIKENGADEAVLMEVLDSDGTVELLELSRDAEGGWDLPASVQEKLVNRLNALVVQNDDVDIKYLQDVHASMLSNNKDSHVISSDKFLKKIKEFQNRGLIKSTKINKLNINNKRLKINGTKVPSAVFNRFIKEYESEYNIRWNEDLRDFEIKVSL